MPSSDDLKQLTDKKKLAFKTQVLQMTDIAMLPQTKLTLDINGPDHHQSKKVAKQSQILQAQHKTGNIFVIFIYKYHYCMNIKQS